MAPILFLFYWLYVKQLKGVAIHALLIFKGGTTGFYFAKGCSENLDLHKLTITIKKKDSLEFDTTKGAPLEVRISAYRWIRLYFCSEASGETLDYKTMIDQAIKNQNLSGEIALRMITRGKQFIDMIMTTSEDSITKHIFAMLAGGGAVAIFFLILGMIFP